MHAVAAAEYSYTRNKTMLTKGTSFAYSISHGLHLCKECRPETLYPTSSFPGYQPAAELSFLIFKWAQNTCPTHGSDLSFDIVSKHFITHRTKICKELYVNIYYILGIVLEALHLL